MSWFHMVLPHGLTIGRYLSRENGKSFSPQPSFMKSAVTLWRTCFFTRGGSNLKELEILFAQDNTRSPAISIKNMFNKNIYYLGSD